MNTIGIFAKEPVPGKVKTRLAATIGNEAAANLYEAFLIDLLRDTGASTDRLLLAFTPDTESSRKWVQNAAPQAEILAQPEGDLGHRIDWFFRRAFDEGARRVVLIGSDSPDLPSHLLNAAIANLDDNDVVVAPATDGGYVLIGLKSPQPGFFDGVRWSSPFTLLDTVAAAARLELKLSFLDLWYDIDTLENLGTFLSLQTTPGTAARKCPVTLGRLEALWPQISKSFPQPT